MCSYHKQLANVQCYTWLSHQLTAAMAKQNVCNGAGGGLINGITMTLAANNSSGKDSGQSGSPMIDRNFSAPLKWTLLLFRDYLRHLGMATMAAIVAILACSLKGRPTMHN